MERAKGFYQKTLQLTLQHLESPAGKGNAFQADGGVRKVEGGCGVGHFAKDGDLLFR